MNKLDYRTFIENNFSIVNKTELRVPFTFNQVQIKLFDSLTGRDIVLKARQEGISSLVLALFTVDFLLTPNSRSVCIAHDSTSTIKLFDRVKYFIKSFEEKTQIPVPMKYNSRSEIVNEELNSYFYVGAAGTQSFGRSATLTNVHFSEIGFYPNPEEIYLSASQAGTPKQIVIESTANGVGDFLHKFWTETVNKSNNYRSHFFGWHDYPEYTAPFDTKIDLEPEEVKLKETYNLTNGQLAWRRLKLSEFPTKDKFFQEYPINAEEAFISSGNPVFSIESLDYFKKKVARPPIGIGNLVGHKPPVFERNEKGYLKIWRQPKQGGQYIIGADPCEGVRSGDYACAQVLDRATFEQVAVLHGRVDPDHFGRQLYNLGYYYNEATIAPERNSIGLAVVLALRELDYPMIYIREKVGEIQDKLTPEIGWQTNMKTKPLMIATTGKAIRDKHLILNDIDTINELIAYQYDEKGSANAPVGGNDDRVMAIMIASEMYNRVPLYDVTGNEITKEPDHAITSQFVKQAPNDFYTQSEFNPWE